MANNANSRMPISANNAKMIINANNTKMKGLLKGLRYISQIFDDNNKDQEMQIGFPTDVKHVAHIGWDGPSTAVANAPSWMNEFQGPQGHSGPLGNGDNKDDSGVKWVSEDSSRAGSRGIGLRSPGHDMPDVPKASRRHSSTGHGGGGGGADSPKREKSDKPKQTRRSSKNRDSSNNSTKGVRQPMDPSQGNELPQNLPDIPKKIRRKKSKDSASVEGSSRRSKAHASSETCVSPGHPSASVLKCSSNDLAQKNSFQEGEGKGFT